ncbi:hypothetical protein BDB00DRAFT_504307 [Zychaea mexicana]|uniref:uncharacterized protein n=1 Tax=Zychaea mexicana TaxID=64656 RepID=UPI0022FE3A60|nr:uncharacterized protein BDB00DRAFT_504307 [Zychaea mexicana]KAI9498227.1 hypothetical protein BDB00DRAFT_504307 [Zychaea mexicana]
MMSQSYSHPSRYELKNQRTSHFSSHASIYDRGRQYNWTSLISPSSPYDDSEPMPSIPVASAAYLQPQQQQQQLHRHQDHQTQEQQQQQQHQQIAPLSPQKSKQLKKPRQTQQQQQYNQQPRSNHQPIMLTVEEKLQRIPDPPLCFCGQEAFQSESDLGISYDCYALQSKDRKRICGFHIHKRAWDSFRNKLQKGQDLDQHDSELSICPFFNYTFCVCFQYINDYPRRFPPTPKCFCSMHVIIAEVEEEQECGGIRKRFAFNCPHHAIDGAKPKCTWSCWAEEVPFRRPKFALHSEEADEYYLPIIARWKGITLAAAERHLSELCDSRYDQEQSSTQEPRRQDQAVVEELEEQVDHQEERQQLQQQEQQQVLRKDEEE